MKRFVALLSLALCSAATAQTENFNPQTGGVTFAGTVQGVSNPAYFDLTYGQGLEASALWVTGRRELKHGFTAVVDFEFASGSSDGITLTFQNERQDAIGSPGQGLGVYQNNQFGGPAVHDGFSIELDAYHNVNDGASVPHCSVQGPYLTGAMSGEDAQSLVPAFAVPSFAGRHKLEVSWDDGVLTLRLDCKVIFHGAFAWPLSVTDPSSASLRPTAASRERASSASTTSSSRDTSRGVTTTRTAL